MKTIKTDSGFIGYLDSKELKESQENLNEAKRNLEKIDKKCSVLHCSENGYIQDDNANWICQEHYEKFSR